MVWLDEVLVCSEAEYRCDRMLRCVDRDAVFLYSEREAIPRQHFGAMLNEAQSAHRGLGLTSSSTGNNQQVCAREQSRHSCSRIPLSRI